MNRGEHRLLPVAERLRNIIEKLSKPIYGHTLFEVDEHDAPIIVEALMKYISSNTNMRKVCDNGKYGSDYIAIMTDESGPWAINHRGYAISGYEHKLADVLMENFDLDEQIAIDYASGKSDLSELVY